MMNLGVVYRRSLYIAIQCAIEFLRYPFGDGTKSLFNCLVNKTSLIYSSYSSSIQKSDYTFDVREQL